jgi:hypothetical protein
MHDWSYEPDKDTPSINSANVLATINKFKMMSPRYWNAVEGNVTRFTHGLIAFALLVRRIVCTTAEPLDIALEGYV